MKPVPWIVCGRSAVLTFVPGCLLHKQETIFLFVDIQKKVSKSQREERRGLCDREVHEKWKVRAGEERGDSEENLGTGYFPICCRAEYILSMLYIWASVSEQLSLLLCSTSKASLTHFQLFILFDFLYSPELSSLYMFCIFSALGIRTSVIGE